MKSLRVFCLCLFFNDTATTEIYTYGHTLSLPDALPISGVVEKDRPALLEIAGADGDDARRIDAAEHRLSGDCDRLDQRLAGIARQDELRALALRRGPVRSEERRVGKERVGT